MSADRNYLAVELAPDGERTAVIETLVDGSRMRYQTDHDTSLIFTGPGNHADALERLQTVAADLSRVAFVHYLDTGDYTQGYYYERDDTNSPRLKEVESVSGDGSDRAAVFDYFAHRYGIHGVL